MQKNVGEIKVTYNDVFFFLVLIPFVNALNYYLTYTNIPFNAHTLLTFLLDTFEGYAAWWGLRSVILFLDRKMPYSAAPLKRIVFQLFATSAVAIAIIILLTESINGIATKKPIPSSFYRYDIFIFLIWFLVLNGVYIALYYYKAMRHIEQLRSEEKKVLKEGFFVRQGKNNLSISFTDIIGFYVEGEYTVAVTRQLKKHFLDLSLDKIEQSVPKEIFFRLNRQYIIGRPALKGFSREENGKLNVWVTCPEFFPESIQVSRTKAPAFKEWYQPG